MLQYIYFGSSNKTPGICLAYVLSLSWFCKYYYDYHIHFSIVGSLVVIK